MDPRHAIPTVLDVLGHEFVIAAHVPESGTTTWRARVDATTEVVLIRSMRPGRTQPWLAMLNVRDGAMSPAAQGETPETAILGLPAAITRSAERLTGIATLLAEMFEPRPAPEDPADAGEVSA